MTGFDVTHLFRLVSAKENVNKLPFPNNLKKVKHKHDTSHFGDRCRKFSIVDNNN